MTHDSDRGNIEKNTSKHLTAVTCHLTRKEIYDVNIYQNKWQIKVNKNVTSNVIYRVAIVQTVLLVVTLHIL